MSEPYGKQCLSMWAPRRLVAPGVIALLALAFIPWAKSMFKPIKTILDWLPVSEFFSTTGQLGGTSTALGVILIIWTLDPKNRHRLVYFVVALLLAGTVNGVIKQTAGRIRPQHSVGLNKKEVAKIAAENQLNDEQTAQLKSDRWLWFSKERLFFHDEHASFPSGHACSAFVTAAFLCILYPPGRYIWIIAALGTGLSRVKYERHYAEDVMLGGAIGWGVALIVFSWCWPMVLGTKIVQRLMRTKTASTTAE